MNKLYIGIDPGVAGGLVCMDSTGKIVDKCVMPIVKVGTKNKINPVALKRWLFAQYEDRDVRMVAIEEQRPMHKMGEVSTFGMGRGYGIIEGVTAAMGFPYSIVRPVDWQKEMFQGLPKGKTKELSKQVATQLFPKENFKRTKKCKNLHDGLTDAALITEYIRRKIK